MTAKEQLRDVLADLSEQEARAALRYLQVYREDPVRAAFAAAPLDDEPLTTEEEQALHKSQAQRRRGEVVALEDLRAELG